MCTRNNNFSNRSQKGKIVVIKKKGKADEPESGEASLDVLDGSMSDVAKDVNDDGVEGTNEVKDGGMEEKTDEVEDDGAKEKANEVEDDDTKEKISEAEDNGIKQGTDVLKDIAVEAWNKDTSDSSKMADWVGKDDGDMKKDEHVGATTEEKTTSNSDKVAREVVNDTKQIESALKDAG